MTVDASTPTAAAESVASETTDAPERLFTPSEVNEIVRERLNAFRADRARAQIEPLVQTAVIGALQTLAVPAADTARLEQERADREDEETAADWQLGMTDVERRKFRDDYVAAHGVREWRKYFERLDAARIRAARRSLTQKRK